MSRTYEKVTHNYTSEANNLTDFKKRYLTNLVIEFTHLYNQVLILWLLKLWIYFWDRKIKYPEIYATCDDGPWLSFK